MLARKSSQTQKGIPSSTGWHWIVWINNFLSITVLCIVKYNCVKGVFEQPNELLSNINSFLAMPSNFQWYPSAKLTAKAVQSHLNGLQVFLSTEIPFLVIRDSRQPPSDETPARSRTTEWLRQVWKKGEEHWFLRSSLCVRERKKERQRELQLLCMSVAEYYVCLVPIRD